MTFGQQSESKGSSHVQESSVTISEFTEVAELRQSKTFVALSDDQFDQFLKHAEFLKFAFGVTIRQFGDYPDKVYFLVSGKVRLFCKNVGHEQTLSVLSRPGDFLYSGEQLLHVAEQSESFRPNYGIRASTDVVVCRIPSQRLLEISRKVVGFRLALEQSVALVETSAKIHEAELVSQSQPLTADGAQGANYGQVVEVLPGEQGRKPLASDPVLSHIRRKIHRYPHVKQPNRSDCGAACLGMVSQFYGRHMNINNLRQLCHVTRYGTSMLFLAEAAEKLGFIARGLKAPYDSLAALKLPVICFWRQNHYVVLYEIDKHRALIGDPSESILHLSKEAFCKEYSGVVLELQPTNQFLTKVIEKSPLAMLLPLCLQFKSKIQDVFLASLAGQILVLIQPIFAQVIIDKVIVHQNHSMLNVMLIGMLILSLVQTAVGYLRTFLLGYVSMRIDQELIVTFCRHLLSLPLKFFQERTIADITTRFEQNRTITGFLTGPGVTTILDAITFVICLSILLFYNIQYAIAAIGYLLLYSILMIVTAPYLKNLNRIAFDKNAKVQGHLIESMRAIENIKAGAAENERRWQWELLFFDAQMIGFQLVIGSGTVNVVASFISLVGQLGLLWLAATLVIEGAISIGQLFALQMIVGQLSRSVLGLVGVWDQIQNVNISLERLGDVLGAEPEEPTPLNKLSVPSVEGHFVFRDVSFRYSELAQTNTLSGVSLEVLPGELVGIVGRSGSGKSTLIRLIQGLYPPNSGTIFVDGKDLGHLLMSEYRKHIGVVSQQEHLCGSTIRECLCLYAPEATTEELIQSTKIAGIHDFIQSLPNGYETSISEGGYNFSGGQRQRLAIARAIVSKPSIVIFDEATSALDTESERHIQKSIEELRTGRTMFVIAHRLSTVTMADKLLVMEKGQIVEAGTHEELIAVGGLYHDLCQQQLSL